MCTSAIQHGRGEASEEETSRGERRRIGREESREEKRDSVLLTGCGLESFCG